jgi:hypothetical protein
MANALSALFQSGSSAIKNKLMAMMQPGDVMSPNERSAYAQATGEDIQGNPIQQTEPMQPAGYVEDPNRKTVDPDAVARYMAARKLQHDTMIQQRGM